MKTGATMANKVYYRTVERDSFLEFHVSRIRSELDGPDSPCCKILLEPRSLEISKKQLILISGNLI
jgi:hypothetical protein